MKSQFALDDTADAIRVKLAWDNVLQRLGSEISPAWFDRFIRPLSPKTLVGNELTMEAPGQFIQEWVRSRFLHQLEHLFSDELGCPCTIKLIATSRTRQEVPVQTAVVTTSAPLFSQTRFKPSLKYVFENFVVGQSNRMAFAGAKSVADDPGAKFNPLFIYGQSGVGKTHLLHAIAHTVLARDPQFNIVYVTAQQFAEELIGSLQTSRMEQFRRSQKNVGMWLVDDIQFIAGKDKTSEEVFHTFNNLQSLGKQIVLCSDRPPRELYLMHERLRSRFEAGLVADIQAPDTETRSAIVLSKAKQENIDLAVEVAVFLSENVPSGNVRVLEGALTKLMVEASMTNSVPTVEMARRMVDLYYQSGTYAKPSVKQIVDAVGKHFRVPSAEINGLSRKAPIVHARHIAVYITREITGDSWKHIGSFFGDRDHTSMMHGYQKISELMNENRDLKNTVKMLIRNLYPDAG